MGSVKLKEDLNNCLINFDRRVHITGLLDDYHLSYKEVEEILKEHLNEQEKKDDIKFEKRYLVHGQQESDTKDEIYEIVKEEKLENWLDKLKNAEFSLYSVEVAGGAKSAAPVFKPMRIEECVKTTSRHGVKAIVAKCISVKSTSPKDKKQVDPDITSTNIVKKESTVEIEVPIKDISPTGKKSTDKKPAVKKGINNFFAPSTSTTKKAVDTKDTKTKEAIKKTTPKNMNDFFKKQAETSKPSAENVKNSAANISVQLFDEEEPEEEESSSDEEEKLEALKRDIISSDVEISEEDEKTVSTKRRRILDSDEEEDPPVKQEKLDIEEETKEEEAVAETYLDEDGFVITKKPKQKGSSTGNKQIATKNVPAVTIKPSSKETNKSSSSLNIDSKPATNPTAKTKQVGIMNFFSKK